MAIISIPNTFTVGAVIVASQHNSNFSTIYSDYNGNVTDANISASANITDTKLAAITTAGKVSGAALTSLSSIPSGGGAVPTKNGGTAADFSATAQGSTLYFSAAGVISSLAVGISGQFLKTQGAAANPVWASVAIFSVLDYGTSLTTSTQRGASAGTIIIAYGQATLSSGLAQITNLPYTSSSTFQAFPIRVNSSDVSQAIQIKSYDSASAFTMRDSLNGSAVVSWITVGS